MSKSTWIKKDDVLDVLKALRGHEKFQPAFIASWNKAVDCAYEQVERLDDTIDLSAEDIYYLQTSLNVSRNVGRDGK